MEISRHTHQCSNRRCSLLYIPHLFDAVFFYIFGSIISDNLIKWRKYWFSRFMKYLPKWRRNSSSRFDGTIQWHRSTNSFIKKDERETKTYVRFCYWNNSTFLECIITLEMISMWHEYSKKQKYLKNLKKNKNSWIFNKTNFYCLSKCFPLCGLGSKW